MDDLRHAEAKMERVEEEIKRHTFLSVMMSPGCARFGH